MKLLFKLKTHKKILILKNSLINRCKNVRVSLLLKNSILLYKKSPMKRFKIKR